MKKSAIVHIGTPKTGTTALQAVLAANRDHLLKEWGILYPASGCPRTEGGRKTGQHLLGNTLRGKAGEIDWDAFEAVNREAQEKRCDRLLISAESLSQLTIEMIRELVGRLNLETSESRIIAYFRDPIEYLKSAYNQKLKNGGYRDSFDEFVADNLDQCDYPGIAARWRKVFGARSMTCFDYRRASEADLVTHFCRETGIELVIQRPAYRNRSLPAEALPALRIFNGPAFQTRGLWGRMRRHVLRQSPAGKLIARLINPLGRSPFGQESLDLIRCETAAAMEVCAEADSPFIREAGSAHSHLEFESS